jgi:hypothetical protein
MSETCLSVRIVLTMGILTGPEEDIRRRLTQSATVLMKLSKSQAPYLNQKKFELTFPGECLFGHPSPRGYKVMSVTSLVFCVRHHAPVTEQSR